MKLAAQPEEIAPAFVFLNPRGQSLYLQRGRI
jgi:hypothetical protein